MKKSKKTPSVQDVIQKRLDNLRSAGIQPRYAMAVALESAVNRAAGVKHG